MFLSIFFTSLLANLTTTDMSTFISVIMAYIRMFAILFVGTFSYEAHSSQPVESLYDFVVVGSGSAGAAVASRLSEVAGWNVLLLEAGGSTPPEAAVPGFNSFLLLEGTEASWGYISAPQRYSLKNYKDKTIPIPRGRTIGGSSAVNFLMHVRGNRRDFDRWASLGNPGWDFDSVLPYFKKMENYRGVVTNETAPYHGFSGPLVVENKKWGSDVMAAFLKAGKELGYPTIDPNAGSQIGFSTPDLTTDQGRRSTAAEAYLRPVLHRPNLKVLPGAQVTKILFNNNKRAVGVHYVRNGERHLARVRREVVVCGGAIGSPQLLMLSGVGHKRHLRQYKIPVVTHLPGVGQNLQDHIGLFGLTWTIKRGSGITFGTYLGTKAAAEYGLRRQGPLSVPFGPEGNAWFNLGHNPDPEWPDIQMVIVSLTPALDSGLLVGDTIGYDKDFSREYFGPVYGKEGINLGPYIAVPKSRGSVTLRSADPFQHPRIDPNYLSHPEDIEIFVKGIRKAFEVANTTAFREDLQATFYDKVLPGCELEVYDSDAYWACFARHMAGTTYHPVGTCKMAPHSDHMAVVDERLRVRGVSGLRVIDASIMPVIVAGNSNAAAIMIGEKGADLIKEQWGVL